MRKVIHVRNGKGGKDRMVPMEAKPYGLLRAYYKHAQPSKPCLFSSMVGKPICLETAQRALLCASAASGIGKIVNPHLLHHAFATHSGESGRNNGRTSSPRCSNGSISSVTLLQIGRKLGRWVEVGYSALLL